MDLGYRSFDADSLWWLACGVRILTGVGLGPGETCFSEHCERGALQYVASQASLELLCAGERVLPLYFGHWLIQHH